MWIYYSFITYMYSIRISTSTGVCSNASSPLKCCLNYRVVGNSCVECWPGTHGVDCKYFCPPSFYGKSCLRKCDCEPCDKVTGCLNATDETGPKKDESPTNSALWLTLSVSASCIVTCFIFGLRIFYKNILRERMLTIKPSDLDEYGSKNQMAPLENSRFSISKTPRTIDLSQTYDTETSYGKCQTTVSNNMTETTSRNDYGCDDSMDGAYKILKVTVSDKNEHMQIPNKTSTPLEIQKHTNVHEDTSQMASSVSNIVKTKNHESKPSIHREKKKHQKELLRALDEFKQGSTRDRKKLRYSFTKSTELF
ncbi:uncharacterized protein LOC128180626 isoform X2 [Crassostrea angulata]|uniref:uncharacterized protein LOC128180626 isoform X2 n=1 Tax=Magallana angulata TaxID=2784310 RepID=UPI0022B1246F|nr:uncharacterized protein LOC128180626 isoform X2 [Crassostrea angulata]